MSRRRRKKKMETSKKILLFCDVMTAGSVIATLTALFMQIEVSGIAPVIESVVGLAAAAHGFYYWKAKAENMHKYGKDDNIDMGG